MARYNFELISELYDIVTIAKGKSVRQRKYLNQKFGRGGSDPKKTVWAKLGEK